MAKKLFIIITVLFSAVLTTKAQVKVTARIDSAEILIGEQTSVHITVEHPQNVQPAFPKNVQQIMKKGVEVVKRRRACQGNQYVGLFFYNHKFRPCPLLYSFYECKSGRQSIFHQPTCHKSK